MKAKALVIVAVIGIGVALILFGRSGDDTPRAPLVAEGFKAPDINLKDLDGNLWSLSSKKGSVVLINFWATWCDTCKEEMPGLQLLYDVKGDNPGFQLVTVVYDDDPLRAVKYLADNNFTLPLYIDGDGSAARAYGLTGVPETYIVGKKGILRRKIIGPADFKDPGAVAFINKLLEEES